MHAPLLDVALAEPVEAEGADGKDAAEEDGAGGTLEGEVALVPEGLVAPRRGHVPGRVSGVACVGAEYSLPESVRHGDVDVDESGRKRRYGGGISPRVFAEFLPVVLQLGAASVRRTVRRR